MQVTIINNDGGGWSERQEFDDGATANDAFVRAMGSLGDAKNFTIKINREHARSDQPLADGDTLTITPIKIAAAVVVATVAPRTSGFMGLRWGDSCPIKSDASAFCIECGDELYGWESSICEGCDDDRWSRCG